MGKRKRIDLDVGQADSLCRPTIDESRDHNRERANTGTTLAIQNPGSSQDAFRTEWKTVSEQRQNGVAQPVDSTEPPVREKKRKKHRKEKSPHDSMTASSSAKPHAAGATVSTQSKVAFPKAPDDQNDSLVPSGASRHQRRRWRRKLIRQGMMPKLAPPGSVGTKQMNVRQTRTEAPAEDASIGKPVGRKALALQLATTTGTSSTENTESRRAPLEEKSPDTWVDKPVGRKAVAQRVATTMLMSPPTKRWSVGSPAPRTNHQEFSPWQLSAFHNDGLILRDSPIVSDVVTNTEVSVPAIPNICTTGPEAKRPSQSRHGTNVMDNSRLSLPSGHIPSTITRRALFKSKANSVPTYSVQGDAADRFKIFSAAVHGKAVGDGNSWPSETSSESGSSDDNRSATEGVASRAPDAETSYDFPLQLDGAVSSQHRSMGGVQPHQASMLQSEFMSQSHADWRTCGGRHRNMFGSDVDGGRSSSRFGADQTQNESQEPLLEETEDCVPLVVIDDEYFDANQAIDDVFNAEMNLTRELPTGKRRRIADPEREDGVVLTLASSDCRVTRSASKTKPAVTMQRFDSAIPDPEIHTVIVRSMQLPVDGLEAVAATNGLEDITSVGAEAPTVQPHGGPADEQGRPSELSNQDHSQPAQVYESHIAGSRPGNPADQFISQNDGYGDTIAVAIAEQVPETKKQRKMTGRTSKHFSSRKATREKAAEQPGREVDPVLLKMPEEQPSKKRKSPSPSKKALAETQELLNDDGPGQEQSIERLKKRSTHISGTLANLSASNILENQSRSLSRSTQIDDETSEVVHDADEQTPGEANEDVHGAVNEMATAHEPGQTSQAQSKGKAKKRSRCSSGTLANLDPSNIIERRSRHSVGNSNVGLHDSNGPIPKEIRHQGWEEIPAAADEEHKISKQSSDSKKRARRSSGTIASLDASNTLERRSRRLKDQERTMTIDAEDPTATESAAANKPPDDASANPKPKRKSTGKRSAYFTPPKPPLDPIIDRVDHYNTTGKKKRVPAGTSTAPVPPISSPRFGIIQEKLWREPFWLLIAVTFLNKTAGRAAAPIFWKLKEQYATPEALAEADQEELCQMVWRLGLQVQRSRRLIKMARAWVEGGKPGRGVRWRVLNYPVKGDGKGLKSGVAVEEDAEDVEGAIEIGKIPGCGPYAWDSWRIFCRDVLRGVADDYNGENAKRPDFVPEWQKVLPLDKELRACLRWMWLREGWIWDPGTGKKRPASEEEMERAVKGEMEVEDEKEREFAARAAGVEGAEEKARDGGEAEESSATAVQGAEEIALSNPPSSEQPGIRRSERMAGRGTKRAVTPEQHCGVSSDDNIVVTPRRN